MQLTGSDHEILQTACDWLAAGQRVALVTVLRTWGSSPRPVGSLMVMRGDGVYSGSVSGGCVEEDLVQRYRDQQLGAAGSTLVDYGSDAAQATRLGLPCGGRLELLVEPLHSAAQLQIVLGSMQRATLMTRRVCLHTGEVSLHPASVHDDFVYTSDHVARVFGPRWQLLLIGAGQLSGYLAQMALMLDYRVIVCDPREGYQDDEALASCTRLRCMPDEAVQDCADYPRTAVIALTHDPKLDDMALLAALASPVFYVGALGSRRNSEQRRERLAALGVSEQQLQRLHAPVGLPIGSRAPAEIAVSILAEITALRHAAVAPASAAGAA